MRSKNAPYGDEEPELRIIAGEWRSRKLKRPDSTSTRPMPDRVKESIFNMLAARYGTPGTLPPMNVADVFAGSGSMGLEALSRGAATCVFFERDRIALDALRDNIAALRTESRAIVVAGDAWRLAATREEPTMGLIFLDPPYQDSRDASEGGPVHAFLRRLLERRPFSTVVVLHHPADVEFRAVSSSGWNVTERRDYGTNGVTIFNS